MIIPLIIHILISQSCNAMEQKVIAKKTKEQLITIFDVQGKFFQKNIEDVKAILPAPFQFAIHRKNNKEEDINCISLKDFKEFQPFLTKERLQPIFSLYSILKTKPKTLNQTQRQHLKAANDFFIIGDFFCFDPSLIEHLKFLTTRYCKSEALDLRLDPNTYRYNSQELFQKGFITRNDILPHYDENSDYFGIDLTKLDINFHEFISLFPIFMDIKKKYKENSDFSNLKIDYTLITKLPNQKLKNTLLNNKKIFKDTRLALDTFGIHSYQDLNKLIKLIKSHPSTCLNLSNLNLDSYQDILEHISLTEEEKLQVLTVKLNHNHLEKLSCIFFMQTFFNLTYLQAKHNNIYSLDEKIINWFNWKDHQCLKKLHVNAAHNNLQFLPRVIKYNRSKCGPCNWKKGKKKLNMHYSISKEIL